MTDAVEVLRAELGRRAAPSTRNSYMHVVRRFVAYTSKQSGYTRQDMLGFLDSLDMGTVTSRSYQRLAYYALKRLSKALGESWPLDKNDLSPKTPTMAMNRPVITRDNLETMIGFVRQHEGWWGQAYLCLGSIYGLRRVEMTSVDIDLENSLLTVHTAKHGNWRQHTVPNNLKPYLATYIPQASSTVSGLYNAIARGSGIGSPDGEGWHAIRRLLDTELILAAPVGMSGPAWYLMVKHFLRWQLPAGDMAAYYFSPQEVDKQIFTVHPFLGLW